MGLIADFLATGVALRSLAGDAVTGQDGAGYKLRDYLVMFAITSLLSNQDVTNSDLIAFAYNSQDT